MVHTDDGYNWLALQKQAHREFGRAVAAITDWDAPTPDVEWNVHDLVLHVVQEQQWVPQLLSGLTIPQAKRQLAHLGSDLGAEWRLYSLAATAAWDEAKPDAGAAEPEADDDGLDAGAAELPVDDVELAVDADGESNRSACTGFPTTFKSGGRP